MDDAEGHGGGALLDWFLAYTLDALAAHPKEGPADAMERGLSALAGRLGRARVEIEGLAAAADWIPRARAYLVWVEGQHARAARLAAESSARAARAVALQDAARIAAAELRAEGITSHLREARRPGAPPIGTRDLETLCRVAGLAMGPTAPAAQASEAGPDFERMSVEELDQWEKNRIFESKLPRRA